MEIRNINTCLNCENLQKQFMCSKHNQEVDLNNFCDSHAYKHSITKNSSCTNCSHFGRESCSRPTRRWSNTCIVKLEMVHLKHVYFVYSSQF